MWSPSGNASPSAIHLPSGDQLIIAAVSPAIRVESNFRFWAAKRRDNIDTHVSTGFAVKGYLRTVGRPCRADPVRRMLRQAQKSFAPDGFHI